MGRGCQDVIFPPLNPPYCIQFLPGRGETQFCDLGKGKKTDRLRNFPDFFRPAPLLLHPRAKGKNMFPSRRWKFGKTSNPRESLFRSRFPRSVYRPFVHSPLGPPAVSCRVGRSVDVTQMEREKEEDETA